MSVLLPRVLVSAGNDTVMASKGGESHLSENVRAWLCPQAAPGCACFYSKHTNYFHTVQSTLQMRGGSTGKSTMNDCMIISIFFTLSNVVTPVCLRQGGGLSNKVPVFLNQNKDLRSRARGHSCL